MPNLHRIDEVGWTGTNEQCIKGTTYSFSTANKFNDKDICFTVYVPGIRIDQDDTFYIEPDWSNSGIPRFTFTTDSDGNMWVE